MLLGLAMKNAVKHVRMYILDFGNSALIPYQGLPHVADYMGLDDTEKMEKFERLILEMIRDRKKRMAKAMAQNFNVYNQSQEEPLAAVVIAVDNYDAAAEAGDAMLQFLQKVARDGAGLGIYLAVTMTRENVMRGATKGNFKERIAGFNFVDGENYSFLGRSQIGLPEDTKGRALVKQEGICLMQLYAAVPCEDELSYNRLLKERIKEVAEASTEESARGIPVLPEVLRYEMLPEYPGYQADPRKLPVGIDVDSLKVRYLDFTEGPALVIGGAGSGRTNTVKNVLQQLSGEQTYLFDAKSGDLRMYEREEAITYAGDGDGIETALDSIRQETEKRREAYEQQKAGNHTLKEYGHSLPPVFILVDVIQDLYEQIGTNNEKLDILAEAVKSGIYMVVTSDTKLRAKGSDFLGMLVESKNGLVLGNIKEQSIFSYTGIREENKKADIGYCHKRGENSKLKLIEHIGSNILNPVHFWQEIFRSTKRPKLNQE